MRKAVLISIRPKWCALIASGQKTIEVRKTRPALETPFKCYIYCTNAQEPALINLQNLPETPYMMTCGNFSRKRPLEDADWARLCNGKVIGEFVCDEIKTIDIPYPAYWNERHKRELDGSCLTLQQVHSYLRSACGYGWHISDLVIYDQPKELSEFRGICSKVYCQDTCDKFKKHICSPSNGGKYMITRPPQSWMYCGDLDE